MGDGRQSLVTPIDWKLLLPAVDVVSPDDSRRQFLVTPIDWKLDKFSLATGSC